MEISYEALDLRLRYNRRSISTAKTLNNLGNISRKANYFNEAVHFLREALDIIQDVAPGRVEVAQVLSSLADLAIAQGNAPQAESYIQRAIAIFRRQAPSSIHLAMMLNQLGNVVKARDPERAFILFSKAVNSFEEQMKRLGGRQGIRFGYSEKHRSFYKDATQALINAKCHGEAFLMLERSRAQTQLLMLAERTLKPKGTPTTLVEMRESLYNQFDEEQAKWKTSSLDKERKRSELAMADIQEELALITNRIRLEHTSFADLQFPECYSPSELRAVLDPGTVLLSYHVTEDKALLFLVSEQSDLTIYHLPITESMLKDQVRMLGRYMLLPKSKTANKKLKLLSESLFQSLLLPAIDSISQAKRLLIIPDGPLHALPFSALITPADGVDRGDYLIQWKPIHQITSASVYARLIKDRPKLKITVTKIVAFGDPTKGSPDRQAALNRNAESILDEYRGENLGALPFSSLEVNYLREIFGSRVQVYTGKEATEERAKAINNCSILHFATHAIADDRFPLNASLVLNETLNYDGVVENGFLQPWEIIEHMDLHSTDLVVLSACRTAGSRIVGGEGLVGLASAFRYAGTRSVIATLWDVRDESTSLLMKHFYKGFEMGVTKDEALRDAQLAFIHASDDNGLKPEFPHPLYWAGFHLRGDWR